jgi:DNA-binding CsgD family transcriptional regulator
MRKRLLLSGLAGGLLLLALQLIQYRWLVVERSVEIYGGLVAAIFSGFGIWLGRRITHRNDTAAVREVSGPAAPEVIRDESRREALGITARELEILQLIAEGLSTREIALRARVSENTVKTHSSRLFDKLGARRRTQAVQRAKQFRLIG